MSADACGSCAVANLANLQRLGLQVEQGEVVVALTGNPNTGKSTVFNMLTGLRQHVGNWPGTTVTRAEGAYRSGGAVHRVVDLPGTYSLLSTSSDEDAARDFLLFGDPDVTVVVVDATRLERNLNLVLQVLQITDRVVVALNMMDEAARHGVRLDVRHLERELEVPVVPMSARRGEGVSELLEAIASTAAGTTVGRSRPLRLPASVAAAVDLLAGRLAMEFAGLSNVRWVALRLLEGDASITDALVDGRLGDLDAAMRCRKAS
ncbi:FeoB small GTPase domain-containing protein [Nocardioides ginsengisoli]|uniref:FeoB small GTPase domain-containing protein n=1 Tax=Nocardioides ginsengisoli TaxID=363868 RepID=A0ABW3VVX9_9ACTN